MTILELMVTLSVAAIITSLAVPNVRDIIRNNRLTAAANDLLHSTNLARSEAVKRQAAVVICASADSTAEPPSCRDGGFTDWIVFVDTNGNGAVDGNGTAADPEPVIQKHGALHPSVTVRNDGAGIISYAASGFATAPGAKTPSTRVVICDARGNEQIGANSTARAIVIAATGRTRVTKAGTDVDAAIGIAGGCPQ
jgi:type IV fimbrial biogenesis protein FimT